MTQYDNEKTISFYAANIISTQGYYILNAEQLQKKRVPEEEIKRKVKSFQERISNEYLSCSERLLLISKMYETLGRDLAIKKLLLYPTEKERFICFNELIRQSTNEDGTRCITGEKSIFDIDIITFTTIYEYRNRLFSMLSGKKEYCHYAPIEVSGGKTIEIGIPEKNFSNTMRHDKRISNIYPEEFIGLECSVSKYYQIYKEYMLRTPSDIIGEYFDKYNGTVTRAELGIIYHDYFIPDEMSKFTYRMGKSFPRY